MLAEMKAGGPEVPAPSIVDPVPDAPPAKKASQRGTPELECRVYVPAANLTVSVACGK